MSHPKSQHQRARTPRRARLPGFIRQDIGLGDAIERATSRLGIRHCGGCASRRAWLNRLVVFTGSRRA
jgi:hypothetical protein